MGRYTVRAEIKQRIANGTYHLGVPVVASEISKLAISNEGEVIQKKINVNEKNPLQRYQERSPNKEQVIFKNYYTQFNKEEIISELQKIHEEVSDDVEEMRSSLQKYQRQRHWLLWNDHSTLANYGHMLFCV